MKSEVRKWIFADFITLPRSDLTSHSHLHLHCLKIHDAKNSSSSWMTFLMRMFIDKQKFCLHLFGCLTTYRLHLVRTSSNSNNNNNKPLMRRSPPFMMLILELFYVTTWNAIKSPVLETFCVYVCLFNAFLNLFHPSACCVALTKFNIK